MLLKILGAGLETLELDHLFVLEQQSLSFLLAQLMTDLWGPQLPKFTGVLRNDINLTHSMNLRSVGDYGTMYRYHERQWIIALVVRPSRLIQNPQRRLEATTSPSEA